MTEPQSITADHVRTLLRAAEPAAIVLLVERVGPQPDDAELQREAGALTAAVQQLGG